MSEERMRFALSGLLFQLKSHMEGGAPLNECPSCLDTIAYCRELVGHPDPTSGGLAAELCHGCWKTGSDTHWANVPWHKACAEAYSAVPCSHPRRYAPPGDGGMEFCEICKARIDTTDARSGGQE